MTPASRIAGHRWWHTIDVAPGVSTPGAWDLRPMAGRIPWPDTLSGARCLDVGTMDGFWAFEMERRGAAEVVGIDVGDSAQRFRLAGELRGSRAVWETLNVYDLSRARIGQFDLVFIGYTLNLLRDPIGALEAIRGVCTGAVIVLDEISLALTLLHRGPLARFAPRPGYQEWWVFNTAGLRRALNVAGFEPKAESRLVKHRPGPGTSVADVPVGYRLRHAVGLAGVSLAIKATPC